MNSRISGILLLISATMIWGIGFIGTRWTLADYSGTWSNGMRFVLCLPIIIPYLLYKKTFFKGREYIQGGMLMGLFLFLALWTQTVGISQTTVAKAGFFTVFYAFFTPIISMFIFKVKLGIKYWSLVMLAMFGIALLCELKIENFTFGDSLVLLSAFFFSIHILITDKIAKNIDSSFELNLFQSFFVAILGFVVSYIVDGAPNFAPLINFSEIGKASSISGFIILSFFSTILAFSIQIVAQKKISSHIASFVFLMESVFAAVFGYLFLNESLSLISIIGAFVVLLSVGLVPLILKKNK